MRRARRLLLVAVLLAASASAAAAGGTSAEAPIKGNVPAAVAGRTPIGPHDPTSVIRLNVGLQVRNSQQLDRVIRAASTPGMVGSYLTRAEYTQEYAPLDSSAAALRSWLAARGLHVIGTAQNNLYVKVTGTTAAIDSAFNVTIGNYRASSGRVFYSNDRAPTVPGNLSISWITGLDDYGVIKTTLRLGSRALHIAGARSKNQGRSTDPAPLQVYNCTGSTPYTCFYPSDFRTAYNVPSGWNASGVTIGMTLWGKPPNTSGTTTFQTDLNTFASNSGSTALTIGGSGDDHVEFIPVDGSSSITGSDPEVAMDIEDGHGVAPGSHIKYFLGSDNSFATLTDTLSAAANDSSIHVVSNSWGCDGCSLDTNIDAVLQYAASVGTTFYFSSGDNSTISYPSDSPYVVAVGGTSLTLNAGSTYASESAWSGSGDGCTSAIARPSWQYGASVTAHATCSGRATPDISADADPNTGAYVQVDGTVNQYGGTSLSAPLWAGFTADWNKARADAGLPTVGFDAPLLYSLANNAVTYAAAFHDVTTGSSGGHSAATGWDEVTGWGSPNFAGLAAATLTGLLRVTTSPALASQILIDGVSTDSWGLNWLELDPGTYTLSFTHVEGYTEPAPQQVTITAGQTTTVTGTFTQRGELRVITSPAVPATISVDGTPMNDWGLWTDLPVGSHQVCFGPTPDFTPPACQNITLVAGQQTTVTGTFTPSAGALGASGKGLLRVTTSPALASQILIDGVIADSWGLNWLELDPGTYTLSFTHVEGYTGPAPQQVTITAGQTTTVTGTFTQRGELRVITSPAVAATISVDGIPMNDWGLWTDLPVGSHQVCFGTTAGYLAPACQNVTLTAGQQTNVTGTYQTSPYSVSTALGLSPSSWIPSLVQPESLPPGR